MSHSSLFPAALAQDFHSSIEDALSDAEYVAELHGAMLEQAAPELAAGQERAAQRTLRKAELKARTCHCVLDASMFCHTLHG